MHTTPRGLRSLFVTIKRLAAVVAVTTLCLIGVQWSQHGKSFFDPIDETAHFDYVMLLSQGQIPAWGDTYSQETLLIADCLGSYFEPNRVNNCSDTIRDATQYPPEGFSYEAQQPPLGYVAYVPGALFFQGETPEKYLNHVRDWGGAALIGVSGVFLFLLSRKLRLGFWLTVLLSGIIMLAPSATTALGIVSNDGPTLVGALGFTLALVSSFLWSRRTSAIVGAGVGVALGLIKSSTLVLPFGALCAIVGYSVVRVIRRRSTFTHEGGRGEFIFAASAFVANGVVAALFHGYQSIRATVPSGVVLNSLLGFLTTDVIQPATILSSIGNLMQIWGGHSNGLITSPQLFYVINSAFLVLLGFSAWMLGTSRAGWSDVPVRAFQVVAVNWISTIILFGVSWPVLQFLQGGFNFDAAIRFGLLVLPLVGVLIAGGLRTNGAFDGADVRQHDRADTEPSGR